MPGTVRGRSGSARRQSAARWPPRRRDRRRRRPGERHGAGSRAPYARTPRRPRGTGRDSRPARSADEAAHSGPTAARAPRGTHGRPSARRVPPCGARHSSDRPRGPYRKTVGGDRDRTPCIEAGRNRPPDSHTAESRGTPAFAKAPARSAEALRAEATSSTSRGSPSPSRRPAACARNVSK